MTETQFIEANKEQWEELERLLMQKKRDPDRLHQLFVKVSSDLAYASTFYPKRSVRAYLNQLTQRVFDSMEEKKTSWSLAPVVNFFKHVLPVEMYTARKILLTSFIVFGIAVMIGVVSTAHDADFPRIILGDDYVEMTERNIDNNDPMAVYKGEEQSEMFLYITSNNIRVSFLCYILGIFGSLGTIIILFHNGIMVGAFQYYFYTKGLFLESFLTIWIHGTIEISAIIIAGAAGIVLGNGLLFPATFDRGTSMQIAAKRSMRIIVGTIPLFVIAGFLESFITRLTDMPDLLKVMIIALSLLFILGMYVFYPWWYHHHSEDKDVLAEIEPSETSVLTFERLKFRDLGENIYLGFAQFRLHMGRYFGAAINPLLTLFVASLTFYQLLVSPHDYYLDEVEILMGYDLGGVFLFSTYWLLISYAVMILSMIYHDESLSIKNILIHMKLYFLIYMLLVLIPVAICYFYGILWLLALFVALPPPFLAYTLHMIPQKGWRIWKELGTYYSLAISCWGRTTLTFIFIALMHVLVVYALYATILYLFIQFIQWHDVFSGYNVTYVLLMTTIMTFVTLFMLPLYFYLLVNQLNSHRARQNATDLWKRFESFNTESNILE